MFDDLKDKEYLVEDKDVIRELNRIGRLTPAEIEAEDNKNIFNTLAHRLQSLEWDQVFLFCERTYEKLLTDNLYTNTSIEEVRQYFEKEINQILDEENIAFFFKDGQFHRKGHAKIWHSFRDVGKVLAQPRFEKVKYHYNKARKFFNQRPDIDAENCIKESLCALEACLEVLIGKPVSNFNRVVKQLEGNEPRKIPPPIAEGIVKLYAYRGSGQGVAHPASNGNRVTTSEAELVLNLTAAYITYLASLYPEEEEVPF